MMNVFSELWFQNLASLWRAVKVLFLDILKLVEDVFNVLRELLQGLGTLVKKGWKAIIIRIEKKEDIPPVLLDTAYGKKIEERIRNGGVIHIPTSFDSKNGRVATIGSVRVARGEERGVADYFVDGLLIADNA